MQTQGFGCQSALRHDTRTTADCGRPSHLRAGDEYRYYDEDLTATSRMTRSSSECWYGELLGGRRQRRRGTPTTKKTTTTTTTNATSRRPTTSIPLQAAQRTTERGRVVLFESQQPNRLRLPADWERCSDGRRPRGHRLVGRRQLRLPTMACRSRWRTRIFYTVHATRPSQRCRWSAAPRRLRLRLQFPSYPKPGGGNGGADARRPGSLGARSPASP